METCSQSAVRSGCRFRRVASILMAGAILIWTAGLAAQTFTTPRGTVSNVRFARVGTTFTITYDLTSTDDIAIFKVTLEVSFDKGQTFSFKPASVSGDIGEGVKPGKDKKIVWQTSKDTENQEFDQFRFMPVVLSGTAKPIPGTLAVTTSPAGATVVVDGQPSGTTPATINLSSGKHGVAISRTGYTDVREEVEIEPGKTKSLDRRLTARPDLPAATVDLRGQWTGSYPGTMPAQLTIDRQDGQTFSGTLSVTTAAGKETSELQVEGKISGQAIELRELKILSRGAAAQWTLGNATGILEADTRRMSGSGTDGRTSYQWNFSRSDAPAGGTGPVANLRGNWAGTYANSPARLTVERQEGSEFSGTLLVTTKAGKEPSEVAVAGQVSADSVRIREVKVVKPGAASSWSLGAGSATLSAGEHHMAGTMRDTKGTYNFVLDRAETAPAERQAPALAPSAPARALDLRGSWQGTYAGAPAQLTIDRQDGQVFSGVLTLTTVSGKEPSEVQIEARVSGQTVDLREIKLLKRGAAQGWSLGSGSGTVQPNGQLNGTGKDGSRTYQWSFSRR